MLVDDVDMLVHVASCTRATAALWADELDAVKVESITFVTPVGHVWTETCKL
jgi:hypothetical protein